MKFQNIKSLYFNIFLFLIFKNYMYFYDEENSFYIKTTRNVSTIPIWYDDIYPNHAITRLCCFSCRGVRWQVEMEGKSWPLRLKALYWLVLLQSWAGLKGCHPHKLQLLWRSLQGLPTTSLPSPDSTHLTELFPTPTPSLLFTLVVSKGFCIDNSFRSHQTKMLCYYTVTILVAKHCYHFYLQIKKMRCKDVNGWDKICFLSLLDTKGHYMAFLKKIVQRRQTREEQRLYHLSELPSYMGRDDST